MMKRLLLLSLLLVLGLMPAPSGAADAITVATVLNVDIDHGVPLALSAPATSVFIANPDIADVQVMSPTSIMIFGKRTGETTFMATDSSGNTLAQRTVVVAQDLSNLRRELNMAIPGNRIRVEALPNGLVLTGEAHDPASVADAYKLAMRYLSAGGDIVNRVRVSGSNQVQLRVRFAEVQRNIDNTLGIDWKSIGTVAGFTFGLATGISGMVTGANILNNRPNNTDLSLPNDVIGFTRTGKNYSVNGLIDALAQDGLITILAEPNLTAMSGETANFLAGGEFPIPVPQGNSAISIQFKNYGISLEFTPTIIGDNRINIHVKPEVSQLTTTGSITIDNIAVPALLTRKAETTIEVASGQSFAIAGLLDNSQAQTVNKYPLLGDLPVLGALFRSDRFQNGQTELVIIITPYVVTPSGQELALPTDGFSPPSEIERLWDGRHSSGNPDARPLSGQPVGRMIEPPAASTLPALPIPPVPASALVPAEPVARPPAPVAAKSSPPAAAEPMAAEPAAPMAAPVAAVSAPASAKPRPHPSASLPARENPTSLLAPAGPGGFVLE